MALRLCSLAPRTEMHRHARHSTARRASRLAAGCAILRPSSHRYASSAPVARSARIPRCRRRSSPRARCGLVGQAPSPPRTSSAGEEPVCARFPHRRVQRQGGSRRTSAIELAATLEQPAAKEALLQAFKDAGLANVVDQIACCRIPRSRQAARHRDGQRRRDEDEGLALRRSSAISSIMGMVVRTLKSEARLVLRAVARRPLPGLDGARATSRSMTKEQARGIRPRAARVVVTSLFAFVGNGLRQDAPAVCDLVVGDVLSVAGPQGRAGSAVQLPDGRKGFVADADATDYGRGRRRAHARRGTSSRPRGGSWACRTCGAAPRRKGSTARASSRPSSA